MNKIIYSYKGSLLKGLGRYFLDERRKAFCFSFSASGFEVRFFGTEVKARILANNIGQEMGQPYFGVVLDDMKFSEAKIFKPDKEEDSYTLVSGLERKEHLLRLYKLTESHCDWLGFKEIETDGRFLPVNDEKKLFIEAYGDSITCGDGIDGIEGDDHFETRTENALHTYTALLSEKLDADFSLISVGGFGLYKSPFNVNSPIRTTPPLFNFAYYDDNTCSNNAILWDNTNNRHPDYVLINLGTNDNHYLNDLEGNERATEEVNFKKAYSLFINLILTTYPQTKIIMLTGMIEAPIVEKLIKEVSETINYPQVYFLKLNSLSVGGYRADNGHPNRKMHEEASEELFRFIANIGQENA